MKTKLNTIHGVGKKTVQSLFQLGITCVEDFIDQDPEEIYQKDCQLKQEKIDRCQLYVYRMCVAYAKTKNPDLRWWHFKDKDHD